MSVPFLRPGQTDAAVPRMKKALVRELMRSVKRRSHRRSTSNPHSTARPRSAVYGSSRRRSGSTSTVTVGKDTWAALGVHEPVVGIPRKDPKRVMAAATTDFSTKEATIAAIKSACGSQGIGLKAQIAYVLATVDHETAHTFKPVREAYWLTIPTRT